MILENLIRLYDFMKPTIMPAVSGACDGAVIGIAASITAIVTIEFIKRNQGCPQNRGRDRLAKGVLFLVTTIASGILGGTAGSTYRIGKEVLLLQTPANCALTLTTIVGTTIFMAKQWNII